MADEKISQLDELFVISPSDFFPIVQNSIPQTKKTSIGTLSQYLSLPAGFHNENCGVDIVDYIVETSFFAGNHLPMITIGGGSPLFDTNLFIYSPTLSDQAVLGFGGVGGSDIAFFYYNSAENGMYIACTDEFNVNQPLAMFLIYSTAIQFQTDDFGISGQLHVGTMPTSDPADGKHTLWADPSTHAVYRGT